MDKLKMRTSSLADENYAKLAELFPNAITETIDENGVVVRAIDPDVLQQEINTHVLSGKEERYQFTWPDKRKSVLFANAPIAAALRPCREESVNFDTTENLYIEGDNLDVLKLLRETYLNRVKMIYIDPPYNTGNDFIYEDDFAEDAGEFLVRDGQYDEDGNRMTRNLDSNGRFHTDWLNMIYPRLRLARDLLTEDGVIFISIDFNEVENLKKIMNEIFGEENFQREIVWRIGWLSGYKTTAPNFIRNHDTIMFYSKNSNSLDFNKKYIENRDFKPLVKKEPNITEKLTEFGLSSAQQTELLRFINHDNRPERYPIEDTWNCNEYDDLNSIAIVSFSGEKISKILNVNQDFKGQKSIKMLARILESSTTEDDIVLDFFSGTGSTAHAVMQLNAEDGGKRKFIMVQLPEICEENSEAAKSGYKNICEIGKERIRRAGRKIVDESPLDRADLDIGFRVLKLDSSNMKDVYYTPDEYAQMQFSLDGFMDNIKEDRTSEDLLFQVMLELGIPLSSKIEQIGKMWSVDDGYLIACFGKTDTALITEIAKQKPSYAAFRDSSFASDSSMVNFEQIFATHSPSTNRMVL